MSEPLLSLHASVYALPASAIEGPSCELRGVGLLTLQGGDGGRLALLETFAVTFEQAQGALLELPRCDCEPDGFFLITGHTPGGVFWRLSGHLNEHEERLHRVELNGECPAASLDAVLRCFGWPATRVAFELVREGVVLDEAALRRYAAAAVEKTRLASDAPASSEASRVVPTAANNVTPPPSSHTPWHITWGTYGTRLHGDARPTVDLDHNEQGTPFLPPDEERRQMAEASLVGEPVLLTAEQREFIEQTLPAICERGGWVLRVAAAQSDHVHVVCDVPSAIHGEKVRRLMKRWLGDALNERWPDPDRPRWWAVQGSNKAIRDEAYLRNAVAYVERQRTLA